MTTGVYVRTKKKAATPGSFQKGHCSYMTPEIAKRNGPLISKGKLGKKIPKLQGERSHMWKGDLVGYRALHKWVERTLGTPSQCVFCFKQATGHNIHWANVSGHYKRDITDWVRLCAECHRHFDKDNRQYGSN